MSGVDLLIDTLADVGKVNLSLFSIAIFILTHLLSHYLYINRNIKGLTYDPIMSVITYLLQKIPIKVYNVGTYVICVTLTIILFYFILIFGTLLHVNLVKFDPPIVINNYDDIIERLDDAIANRGNVFKVAWSNEFPDTELFKNGIDGSREKLIWDKNIALNGAPYYVKLGIEMTDADAYIKDQNMIVILNKGYSYFVRNALCDFNDAEYNFHSWISVDRDANWNQKGYVIRESLSGDVRTFVDVRTRRVLEGGFMLKLYDESRALRVDVFPQYKRLNCSSETIQMNHHHETEEGKLGNAQFKVLYIACAIMIVISIICIVIEERYSDDQDTIGVWMMQVRPVKLIKY